MYIPSLKQQVVEELNATAGESKEVHTLAADVVIDALLRSGYRIIPALIKLEGAFVAQFEQTVARWCAEGNVTCSRRIKVGERLVPCNNQLIHRIEAQDVNGASILQSLISDGWTIIPPQ